MFRKDLIELLRDNPMSIPRIARELDQPPRRIESDLEHLFKSLKHTEFVSEVTPSRCRKCGFEFSREKLGKPSRCPECKSGWVTEPRISVRARPGTAVS